MLWSLNELKHEIYRRIEEIVYSSYLYSQGSEPASDAKRKVKELYLNWKMSFSVDKFPKKG